MYFDIVDEWLADFLGRAVGFAVGRSAGPWRSNVPACP